MQENLGTEKISKLLLKLAIPSILAQIISLAYNMVDRIYIGRIEDGMLAMAAIGICVPVVTIINAFANLFGQGGAPLTSILLGKKDEDGGSKIMTQSFLWLIISSIIITVSVLLFSEPILTLFGASEGTMSLAKNYILVYVLGTLFVQMTVGMNSFINAQGLAKYGLVTIILGAGLNIILDPLFIFTFNMGVTGAAVATVISQIVSFIWVIKFFFGKKTVLKIKKEYLKIDWKITKEIITLGMSPFFMGITEGILLICFNTQLLRFGGEIAVSSMTILSSMFQMLLLPVMGITAGSQPIMSYNYGSKQLNRVKDTFSLAWKSSSIYCLIATGIMLILPNIFFLISLMKAN